MRRCTRRTGRSFGGSVKMQDGLVCFRGRQLIQGYVKDATEYFPRARIVFDKFHVMALAGRSPDLVRANGAVLHSRPPRHQTEHLSALSSTMNNRSLQQENPTNEGETRALPTGELSRLAGRESLVDRGLLDMTQNHCK